MWFKQEVETLERLKHKGKLRWIPVWNFEVAVEVDPDDGKAQTVDIEADVPSILIIE